jgi:hypothetical protein
MRRLAILLAAVLATAPLGAQAADLVVWWEKGYDDQEDEGVSPEQAVDEAIARIKQILAE